MAEPLPDPVSLPAGDVALMFPYDLRAEAFDAMRARLAEHFPGRRFLILDGGATVASIAPEQLDRIEAKLDALLAALADEEVEADEPAFSLDGEPVEGGERNQDDEL